MSTVLVTGGAGYIGSHTVLALLREGHSVIIVDDLRNSKMEVVRRIGELSGRDFSFHQTDVCNGDAMHRIFENFRIDAVIHFAGLKAVAESVAVPLAYYRNNLDSTLTLLELMTEFGVTKIVFSSSATVYDPTSPLPLSEQSALRASNPYGWSKLMNEESYVPMLRRNRKLRLFCCAILIPLEQIRAGVSVRILKVFPITSCHILHK